VNGNINYNPKKSLGLEAKPPKIPWTNMKLQKNPILNLEPYMYPERIK